MKTCTPATAVSSGVSPEAVEEVRLTGVMQALQKKKARDLKVPGSECCVPCPEP
jgi:hypothetical protein